MNPFTDPQAAATKQKLGETFLESAAEAAELYDQIPWYRFIARAEMRGAAATLSAFADALLPPIDTTV